jgi:hypothetical protein
LPPEATDVPSNQDQLDTALRASRYRRRVEDDDVQQDLDWVRRQIVELDDAQRSLDADDLAERDRIHRLIDGLRVVLREGNAVAIDAARAQWSARAGRKGEHEIDVAALEGFVRSMMTGPGR